MRLSAAWNHLLHDQSGPNSVRQNGKHLFLELGLPGFAGLIIGMMGYGLWAYRCFGAGLLAALVHSLVVAHKTGVIVYRWRTIVRSEEPAGYWYFFIFHCFLGLGGIAWLWSCRFGWIDAGVGCSRFRSILTAAARCSGGEIR